jgi:hypothetical protein
LVIISFSSHIIIYWQSLEIIWLVKGRALVLNGLIRLFAHVSS